MQLTHPAFLILDSPDGKNRGTRSLKNIADRLAGHHRRISRWRSLSAPSFRSIRPARSCRAGTSSAACARCSTFSIRWMTRCPPTCAPSYGLVSEDQALRDIHLAEDESERGAGAGAADLRRSRRPAVGAGRPPAQRAVGIGTSGAAALRRSGRGTVAAVAFRVDRRDNAKCSTCSPTELAATRPMNRLLQGEVGSGKTIVAVLAMLQMVDAGYQCALLAPTEVLAAQHLRSISDVLGPLAMAGQLGGAVTTVPPGSRCSPAR